MQAGEAWLMGKASAFLVVPSVIVPEESNVLINPQHADTDRIRSGLVFTVGRIESWWASIAFITITIPHL